MAASTYLDQVQQLYVAYFGRPADPFGQRFWAQVIDDANGSIASVIAGFSASAESLALYGNSTPAQKVLAIYQNVFGRAPESAGLAYWVAQIDSGSVSQAQAAWTIQQSAGPGDATTVNNRLIAANAFTAQIDTPAEMAGYNGSPAAALGRAYLSKVDATYASIANVATDSATAVATATGNATVVPVTPAAPVFGVLKDANSVVTFTNPGTQVNITEAAGVYTFTSSGGMVGTATVSGAVAAFTAPVTTTLITSSATASGRTFAGSGKLVLTDNGSMAATTLNGIDTATVGLLVATDVSLITGTAADIATVASASGISTNDTFAVTILDSLTGASGVTSLNVIDNKTSTAITATLAGTMEQLKLLNTNGVADANAYSLTVSDSSAAASDLALLDQKTSVAVVATSITNITGTSADVLSVANAVSITKAVGFNTTLSGAFTVSDINSLGALNPSGSITYNIGSLGGTTDFTGVTRGLIINGGSGVDNIIGGSGNDTLNGGAGDTLFGGAGNDTFNVTAGTVTISDLSGSDVVRVSVGATAIADNVTSFTASSATTNSGTATLNTVTTGATIDLSKATGSKGFTIVGGAGDDTITGTSNSDVIISGGGADTLSGFSGADRFVIPTNAAGPITASSTYTTITDFNKPGDADTISFGAGLKWMGGMGANYASFADLLADVNDNLGPGKFFTSRGVIEGVVGRDTYLLVEDGVTPGIDQVVKLIGLPPITFTNTIVP
jgi:hypothetical protein